MNFSSLQLIWSTWKNIYNTAPDQQTRDYAKAEMDKADLADNGAVDHSLGDIGDTSSGSGSKYPGYPGYSASPGYPGFSQYQDYSSFSPYPGEYGIGTGYYDAGGGFFGDPLSGDDVFGDSTFGDGSYFGNPPSSGPGAPGSPTNPGGTGDTWRLDTLDGQFGVKEQLIQNEGSEEKAEQWLANKGYMGFLPGVVYDRDGNKAIVYDSPFDRMHKDVFGDKWADANHVTKPGDVGSHPEKTGTSDKAGSPDPTNAVGKNIKLGDEKLWNNINKAFTDDNGNLDSAKRDEYLKNLVGDDHVSEKDYEELRWRFPDNPTKVVRDGEDFESRFEHKEIVGSENGKYLGQLKEKHGDKPYVLDQLFYRFDVDKNGKLDDKEAAGLNRYVEGRVRHDVDGRAGGTEMREDWNHLEGKGCKPKRDAVYELINDPTVLDRMPGRSFDGDNKVAGKYRDGYMDNDGGYLDEGFYGEGYGRWQ